MWYRLTQLTELTQERNKFTFNKECKEVELDDEVTSEKEEMIETLR